MESKICNKCGDDTPLTKFGADKRNKDGRQGICLECCSDRAVKYATKRYRNDPIFREKRASYKVYNPNNRKNLHQQLKREVMNAYGGKCFCCGTLLLWELTIDHIDGTGADHRKKVPGPQLYAWLRRNRFPPGFRVACWICNYGAHINNGVCPHQDSTYGLDG